ncbi:sigma-54-dependent transcriptional regulator [Pseudoalteromonas fenneropenaei]|uniref:Sigma-54-dependent transcriptional regulator n=1 Tax=Pseudoalteromonas fenneropenaei TaxID=1737459 RepID=A0ABV7CNU0_9GAMM
MKTVLLVDDDAQFNQIAARILEHLGCFCDTANNLNEAQHMLSLQSYEHIFLDFMLPDGSGLHLVDWLRKRQDHTKVTLISGHPAVKSALAQLCDKGVSHLLKPLVAEDFQTVLQAKKKIGAAENTHHFGCLIGESEAMQTLYELIERVAKTDANVMLLGESGVGKEMVAKAIHNASQVKGDFVGVNCGAIAKELIGSELFGHEKGAFTGAVAQKLGVFEQACNGTLFLDEVTEMPIELQPNLLRVLETQTLTRVGGTQSIKTACRIISASNRSIEQIAKDNVLREDIYFRLAVFPIHIPPLRTRREDIPLLSQFFLTQFNQQNNTNYQVSDLDFKRLLEYDWPGNVRELKHSIHRAYIMADRDKGLLDFSDALHSPFSQFANHTTPSPTELPSTTPSSQNISLGQEVTPGKTIEEVEKALIFETLKSVQGNKTSAARLLGISTKTLYNRLSSYQIEE